MEKARRDGSQNLYPPDGRGSVTNETFETRLFGKAVISISISSLALGLGSRRSRRAVRAGLADTAALGLFTR